MDEHFYDVQEICICPSDISNRLEKEKGGTALFGAAHMETGGMGELRSEYTIRTRLIVQMDEAARAGCRLSRTDAARFRN